MSKYLTIGLLLIVAFLSSGKPINCQTLPVTGPLKLTNSSYPEFYRMPTIASDEAGRTMIAWAVDNYPFTNIDVARSTNGGKNYSASKHLFPERTNWAYCSAITYAGNGTWALAYFDGSRIYLMTSTDFGITWEDKGYVGEFTRTYTWAPPPLYMKSDGNGCIIINQRNELLVSTDYGQTWNKSDLTTAPVDGSPTLDTVSISCITFVGNGEWKLAAQMWNANTEKRYIALYSSEDDGLSWIGTKINDSITSDNINIDDFAVNNDEVVISLRREYGPYKMWRLEVLCSNNAGLSWAQPVVLNDYRSEKSTIAISKNESHIVTPPYIYTTTDLQTWQETRLSNDFAGTNINVAKTGANSHAASFESYREIFGATLGDNIISSTADYNLSLTSAKQPKVKLNPKTGASRITWTITATNHGPMASEPTNILFYLSWGSDYTHTLAGKALKSIPASKPGKKLRRRNIKFSTVIDPSVSRDLYILHALAYKAFGEEIDDDNMTTGIVHR